MTRPAVQLAAQTFRADEATGTRAKETVSVARPQLSPCAFACRLINAGQPQDALDILEQEVVSGRESLEVQYLIGRAAFGLRDYTRAQRALCRAVAISPDDAATHRLLARVLLRRGNVLGAVRIMGRSSQSSLSIEPTHETQVPSAPAEVDFEDAGNEEPPTTQWEPPVRSTRTGSGAPSSENS